ncbi:unnamed protein product [Penicillium roqueforti FM164]|uniref:Genomic scaffold, ProqFM164S03 n=1 Tax=Penicillium roqueforti (strain FM164) TaxID=1365484 RepID=W6QBY0_PENRF|nr:unnamed protein product [Penicillium roqueforti FM164]
MLAAPIPYLPNVYQFRSVSYFSYHYWVLNPDDDKFPHSRKCAGVDRCLPLDTQSNGDLYGMLTV